MRTLLTATPEQTRAWGRALGERAGPGTVVALSGELGAGKTCFVQGLGEGLGVTAPVTSPTFVLIAELPGRLPLLHADLYRVEAGDLDGLGLEERIEGWSGLSAVEWAERHPAVVPADHLVVRLQEVEGGRRITAYATGPLHAELLAAWLGGAVEPA
jgi:tRNA threonylcarbamoyladenosine biosynthesis protein TsaE